MNPLRLRPFLFGLLFLFIAAALVFPLTGANPFQTSAGAQTGGPRTRPLPNYDAFAVTRGRSGSAARSASPASAAPQIESGRPVQYEPRLGVPTFLWAPRQEAGSSLAARGPQQSAGDAVTAAREHLGGYAPYYRLSDEDVAAAKVASVHDTGKGPVIVKLKQEVGGVEVFRDEVNVVMNRDLQLVAITGYLTGDDGGAGLSAQDFKLRPAEALSKAVEDLTGTALSPSVLRGRSPEAAPGEVANAYTLYTADGGAAQNFGFAEEPSRVKRVMFHLPDGYVPAYYVEAFVMVPSQDATTITLTGEPIMTELAYAYVISAVDGQLLFRSNLIDEDGEFTYRVWADPATKLPHDTPAGNAPHPKVVPLPDGAQAPFVPQSDVTLKNFPFSRNDPWLAPGATETNGNNVDAFVNLHSPDGIGTPTTTTPTDVPNGDHRAHTSGADSFLYTHQPDVDAFSANARQASITQLFYNVNFLHDWFYDAGFDEASGNAQKDNYGRGGLGSDDIKAQAQDFQSFNNANMLTPGDGSRPRMRMYNFPNPGNMLDVQAPAGIAAKRNIGVSQTGLRNFDVTGEIVIATFANSPTACTVTNAAALAGKIAMFDFDNTDGTGCAFSTRITRVHATGAAAALMVYNSAPANANLVANITGINATHTKPVAVISWNSAAPIKTQLAGASTVTARLLRLADRDGAVDAQIVSHEWGHYISNRLIANGVGLNNQQGGGMGEGWGDFLAMMVTVRPDDTATPSNATWNGIYATATYISGGVPFNGALNHGYYLGGRRTPYSTDMDNYNALTFKHIEDGVALPSGPPIASGGPNSEVHNTGEVWATMLWECYAALLRDTQGDSPRLSFNEAQTRMKNYLVAGLKMTPSSPTFLEARDAMLVAAFTHDYEDGLLFAQAFAKRGAGLHAVAPDRFSADNGGVVESFEAGGALTFVGATLDDSLDNCDGDGYLDNTEEGLLTVTLKNAGFQNLFNTAATVASDNAHVTFPAGATINFAPTQPGETVTASVRVKVAGATAVEATDFTITFRDTGTPAVAPVAAHLFEYVNADESGAVTATDTVEPRQTSWAVTHNASLLNDPVKRWRRVGGSASVDHEWFVADPDAASEQFLTSPVFTVDGSGSVNVQFDHSWGFESSGPTHFDGGVVEMRVNGGAWTDIGTSAYNGTLTNYTGNLNPLKTRPAFVGSSNGTHTSLTQAVAPGSTVQIRFRFGSDNAQGADGWRIDNIAFTGVVETPFRVLLPEADVCHVNPPAPGVTIALSPETLPAATAGSPYAALVTPSGGTAPYTFNVTPVVLPAGLSGSVVAGGVQISGTPERAGTSLVKVTATDANSNVGSRTFALTVNKADSTTTVTAPDAAYDGSPHGATATVTGFGGLNQNLTVTYTGRNSTTYGPSTTAPTNAGAYTASASFAGDADHSASSGSADFSIGKAAQSITFGALANKTFGDAPFAVGATGGGSGNPVTFAANGNCTADGATITINGAGSCTVTASQAGDGNFNAAPDVGHTFNINKADQTITFASLADKTFGADPFAVSATGGASGNAVTFGAAGNCTSGGTNGATITINGAGSCTVTASQAGNSNYNAAPDVARTFNVNKAAATVALGNLSHTYDGTAKAATATTGPSGLGGVTITYTLNSVPVAAPTGAGSYQVTASLSHADYQATDATDTLVIAKAGQTINFAAPADKTFGDPDFALSAAATSGLGVSFTASGQCTISGATVHLTGAGTCAITASQAGDGNFDAAPNVERPFQIGKASQTITFGPLADKTFGNADFPLSATATSVLGVSYGATGACSVTGNLLHITGAGSCTVTASQAGDSNHNPAADVQRSFTINKAGSTTAVTAGDATYDGSPHGGTASATGFGGLDQSLTVTYAGRNGTNYGPSTTAPTNVGDYTASADFPGDADHTGSNGSSDFRITKAGQTITFGVLADKTFGDADFAVSATAGSGLGLSFTASGQCTVSGATVHLTGAGSCTVTASQAGDGNHSAAPNVERSFQIAKGATQTALSSSINPSDYGQHVTFTAVVTASAGAPAGAVTFKDGAETLGTGTLNGAGMATFTTSGLTAGVHTITAEYAGGSDHLASTGTLFGGQTVNGVPTLTVGDVTVTEGDGGTKDAVFTVSLSAASGLGVSVNFATSDGTAAAPGDYEAASGTLSFAPGETTRTVTVKVEGDSQSESDETFTVSLSGPVNAVIGGAGTGTVVDDDAAGGVLRFTAAEYSVAEGAGSVVITVERVGDTSAAASVEYATDDAGVPGVFVPCAATTGAALARCDFTAAAGRLDFAAGEASKTFSVLVTDDAYADGPEALSLVLENPAGGAVLGGAGTALLNITDNDITSSGNPLDITESFVRQHYHDFLNREPDTAGLQFWTKEINSCGTNAACVEARRVNVSAAFFLSIEFQNTGYLVYRSNVAAFGPTRVEGVVPVTSDEFLPDVRRIGRGVIVGAAGWEARLEANKQEYFSELVGRPAFAAAFPSALTPAQFVDALNENAGGALSQAERDALVAELTANNNDGGRASVLRKVADDADLKAAHFNRAFVQMQYFGYLRRDPNSAPDTNFAGYNFWLSKLEEFRGDFVKAEMVRAFITSDEYRKRFGQ